MSDALGRIDAFVLAGGLGTRLSKAVPGLQKVLAPVAGRGPGEPAPAGEEDALGEKAPADPAHAERKRSAPAWISAGVYLLGRPVIEGLAQRAPSSLERDVFPSLVGAGLHAYRGGGR